LKKLKLATILGTRPEIIRLSSIIKRARNVFDHTLIHTGQNYDHVLNHVFFNDLDLALPDYNLNVVGGDLGETIGNIISKCYKLLVEVRPDAVLVLGDTNSALSVIAAKRLKIPIFHIEAGNRCFDENLPEELNRRIIDHVSDINLACSENARINLLSEGISPRDVFVVGSPMKEVLNHRRSSQVLSNLNLESKNYFLFSAHREENIDIERNFYELMEAVNALAMYYKMTVIFPMHPRSKKAVTKRGFKFSPLVKLHEPFCFSDYVELQINARCVISDSGTLAEESAILGFPAVSARTSTERQEVIDQGTMIIGGINKASIQQAVEMAIAFKDIPRNPVPDYTQTHVSVKVCEIIQGYTDIVNRMVWRKK